MIKILTATGGSKHAERAVRFSCRLAQGQTTTLTALTVADPDEITPLEQICHKILDIAQRYSATINLMHASGQPDQVIRQTALQGHDLLVIGARGLHSRQDFFLGRNAIRLIKNLPVSTLVVRKKDTARHILWRIPRGPIDARHVELIVHMINTLQADLTILDVEPSAMLFGHRQTSDMDVVDTCDLPDRVAQLCSKIQAASGKEIAWRIRAGIPEEVILDETAIGNYDLIAVSARPHRGLGKLFGEDLAYRVARNIPVSVLLLN